MKNLPVGQQDFEKLIRKDCIYVDKTEHIHRMLLSGGDTFFLSRPRRFGKSLLLSTIKAIFEEKKELFKGLYIEDKIDWEPHPVVMLDMTLNAENTDTLKLGLVRMLETQAEMHGVVIEGYEESPSDMLNKLISTLYRKTGKQVVVLVDEYDKPILDKMDDLAVANAMREALYPLYGALKASSMYLKLLVVTGITKISQTTIFSGFNNLNDISFDADYAGICGYTQAELEDDFKEYLPINAEVEGTTLEKTLEKIKYWYDGYTWDGVTFVYNPFSVLLLFDKNRYNAFWYTTGTPTFLLKLLKMDNNLEQILWESIDVPDDFTDGQALENLDPFALMFQAGYLTIKSYDRAGKSYLLQLPNQEVREAISDLVLADVSNTNKTKRHALGKDIEEGFRTGNTAFAVERLETLLANTTFNTHAPNGNESHFQALFQLAMVLSGIDHRGESRNWVGQADAVLLFNGRTYVVEIKHAPTAEGLPAALAVGMEQIHDKQYHKPYLGQGKTVHLLALAFTRGQVAFAEEVLNA